MKRGTHRWARLALWLTFLLAWLAPGWAWAQVQIQVQLSQPEAEVNQSVSLELRAEVSDGPLPTSPNLNVPGSFTVMGPSTFRSSFRMQTFGKTVNKRVYTARWQLVPTAPGSYRIPSPTVIVDGEVRRGADVTLKVVPVGKGTQQQRRRRSGFGGFGGFFQGGGGTFQFQFDDLLDDFRPPEPPRARELALPREPDPHIFLRLVADKTKVVVGEQVTLTYYVYHRVGVELVDLKDPELTDFARYDLDAPPRQSMITTVGGRRYHVLPFRRTAVFPLRTGTLNTGTMNGVLTSRRLGRRDLPRESNDIAIEVVEPPKEGRPPGYRLGDVGRFKLEGEVLPRETLVGETVAVRVRLTGVGHLPNDLEVPQRTGITWLEPEKKEDLDEHKGQVGGWKAFGYAVRLNEPGEIDLGAIELPFWDPRAEAYQVARLELGKVDVKPKAGAPSAAPSGSAAAEVDDTPFANLPSPRDQLAAFEAPSEEGLSPAWFWPMILLPPLGVAFAGAGRRLGATLLERRRNRADDPATLAKQALTKVAGASGTKDAATAAERAVHLAVEARCGVRSRGTLLRELPQKLRDEGVEGDLADDVAALLQHLADVRFAPADDEDDEIHRRTKKLVRALLS